MLILLQIFKYKEKEYRGFVDKETGLNQEKGLILKV